jgi:hypothetical protein
MSYVKTIRATAFKGRSFEHELAPCTIIYGENCTGKTAVADALRILLLGYSPRHGSQNAKTWGFAGDPKGAISMSIHGELSDGLAISHGWSLHKGKLSHIYNPAEDQFPMIPTVAQDAREFLGLNGPAKVRFIFNQIDLPALGFTTQKVTARIKADVKVDAPDEDSEAALGQIIEDVEHLAGERDEYNWTYQEWVEKIILRIKEQKADADAVIADMAGTIQGLTQLRAQEGLAANVSVEKELAAAREKLQQAISRRQSLEKQSRDVTQAMDRREKIIKEAELLGDLSKEIADLEKNHADQITHLKKYLSDTPRLLAQVSPIDADVKMAEAITKQTGFEAKELAAKLEADLKRDACPYCKSKGKGWKTALKKNVVDQIADLEKKQDEWAEKLASAKDQIAKLQTLIDASKKRDAEIDQLRTANFEIGTKLNEMKRRNEAFKLAKARLEEMQQTFEQVAPEAIESAAQAGREAQAAVALLEDKERQRIAAMQDLKRAEEARQRHNQKRQETEVFRLALKTLAALQGEMMEAAFAGFMAKVNLFCDGILPGRLEYRDGEIGYFAGAAWVGINYFSGTEELLAFAGLSVALAGQSKIRLVMMDELGRVDRRRKQMIVARMLDLRDRGVIDQFIGIDVTDEAAKPFADSPAIRTIATK